MNHLARLGKLHNHYFIMRHGESQANLQKMIVSHPENALKESYGLTENGREAAAAATRTSDLNQKTIIYSSDYSRARETAEVVRQVVGASEVHLSQALRERNFGQWEGSSTDNYEIIWQADADGEGGKGVEPPEEVLNRTTRLITELESQYNDKDILLVSHGDTLQIVQCGFSSISPKRHRSVPHLEVAEIRPITLRRP